VWLPLTRHSCPIIPPEQLLGVPASGVQLPMIITLSGGRLSLLYRPGPYSPRARSYYFSGLVSLRPTGDDSSDYPSPGSVVPSNQVRAAKNDAN
jgi:hypothetical protein